MTGEKWFLVGVVLIILALAIILFFYGKLHDAFDIKREACRDSVLMRSTFNYNALEVGRKTIPLKCETNKVCFYKDKKLCDELSSRENDKSVKYIQVSNKEEVIKEIAGMVYDCHWMFGEGKANFMPTRDRETDYCLICARFAFDKGMQDNNLNFNIRPGDIQDYMSAHYVDENAKNKVTLMKYVYGIDNWDEIKKKITSEFDSESEQYKKFEEEILRAFPGQTKDNIKRLKTDLYGTPLELSKQYAIASKFINEANWAGVWSTGSMLLTGGLFVAGTVLTGGTGIAGLGVILALAKAGGVIGAVGGVTYYMTFNENYKYIPGVILPYSELKGWGCESIETTS